MLNKKILVGAIAVAAIVGLDTTIKAYNGGFSSVRAENTAKGNDSIAVSDSKGTPDDVSGIIQVVPKDKLPNEASTKRSIECYKNKWDVTPEIVEFVAEDGQAYVLLVPPQSKDKVAGVEDRINQKVRTRQLIKSKFERTPQERQEAITQIKNFSGNEKIDYIDVSGDPTEANGTAVETYEDNRGYKYEYDVNAKKIMSMQATGSKKWCNANQDVLGTDCKFKRGQITEQQARGKALVVVTKELGAGKAKEIIGNSSVERVSEKGNTYVFSYPKGSNGQYQMLVVIEPVVGGLINYQNYLK